MRHLDTLNFCIEGDHRWDRSRFAKITRANADGRTQTAHVLDKESMAGLFGIVSAKMTQGLSGGVRANVEVSSKILGSDCHKLICTDTIGDVRRRIWEAGILEIESDADLLDSAVYKASITDDVRLLGEPNGYLSALGLMRANTRFDVAEYRGGIVFTSTARRHQRRLLVYDK